MTWITVAATRSWRNTTTAARIVIIQTMTIIACAATSGIGGSLMDKKRKWKYEWEIEENEIKAYPEFQSDLARIELAEKHGINDTATWTRIWLRIANRIDQRKDGES